MKAAKNMEKGYMILEGGSEHVLSEETTEKLKVFAEERGLNVGKPVHIGLMF